jgi:hypothetical protein
MPKNLKSILKIVIIGAFFLFIILYGFLRSRSLIFGVKITEVNLIDGATVTEEVIQIKGNAKNALHLTLNNREISINSAGNFEEDFALLPGYNIINIQAKDKFGKSDEKNYQLMYLK